MSNSTIKVYYQDSGYPIKRNLLDIPLNGYTPVKKIGMCKVLSHLHYKLLGTSPFLSNTHWELRKKSGGLWHFFNGISFGKTPWVVTYETALPRWFIDNQALIKRGVKALTSPSCKKLIALSQCTKEFQIRYLEEEHPSLESQIIPKITVVHPPQEPLIKTLNEKSIPNDKIIFTIVGSKFFRKGGKEILKVFDHLLQENAPVELIIVSTLSYEDYASNATVDDFKEAKKIISKYPDRIHHYEYLPNEKVLNTLQNSHVGLLPTYGDTYGYSVLEAQASGCPVISTNIRALPEINNNQCGWVINVPKDRWGRGILNTVEEQSKFSAIIQENLLKIIEDIISDPDQIANKAESSLQRIRKYHNPENAGRQLVQIYDDALQ